MEILPEDPSLYQQIRAVVRAAFPTAAEADLVERLRRDGDAAIALAAIEDEEVLGHAVLSRMTVPMRALGLGPVAVHPARQRQGIGARLIVAARERAATEGWEAVFVLGEPAYYRRFGFSVEAASGFETPYAGPNFLVAPLRSNQLLARTGRVEYPPAFSALP